MRSQETQSSIIEISTGNGQRSVLIDGVPLGERSMNMKMHVALPFTLIFIDDAAQFDVQVWIDGNLKHVVPAQSLWAGQVYEVFSSGDHLRAAVPRSIASAGPGRLRDLMDAWQATADAEDTSGWASIERMFDIWCGNADALFGLLDRFSNDPGFAFSVIGTDAKPEVRNQINSELDRGIHNYLAAGNALIDLTRDFMRLFRGTRLGDAWSELVATGRSFQGASFVTDLRNYAMHYDLPHEGHRLSMSRDVSGYAYSVTASPKALLRFSGWKATSKQFIQESGDHVDLSAVLRQQRDHFVTEWTWLLAQKAPMTALRRYAQTEFAREIQWLRSGGTEGAPVRDWAVPPEWRP